jgi:hypothetical protein
MRTVRPAPASPTTIVTICDLPALYLQPGPKKGIGHDVAGITAPGRVKNNNENKDFRRELEGICQKMRSALSANRTAVLRRNHSVTNVGFAQHHFVFGKGEE